MDRRWALLPGLDKFNLKREALAARLFVFEHQDEFQVLFDPNHPGKEMKFKLLTVYERLFSRDVFSMPISTFLHVLDYAISFRWLF